MGWFDRLEQWIFWAVTGAVSAGLAGGWWMIRLVFTNQQQIEMLKSEIAHRDQLRAEDREDMAEVKNSVTRIENILLGEKP